MYNPFFPGVLVHRGRKKTNNILMKSVFIAFDQSHKEAVMSKLEHLNCRGLSLFEQVQGRGSTTGVPHFGSHAWPSMCSAIITIVDDNKIPMLLAELKEIDEDTPQLGLRAFVWNIEQYY